MSATPRNVRNWWIEIECDGYKKKVEMGPKAKDGGFKLKLLTRDHGMVFDALTMTGTPVPSTRGPSLLVTVTPEHREFVNSGARLVLETVR